MKTITKDTVLNISSALTITAPRHHAENYNCDFCKDSADFLVLQEEEADEHYNVCNAHLELIKSEANKNAVQIC